MIASTPQDQAGLDASGLKGGGPDSQALYRWSSRTLQIALGVALALTIVVAWAVPGAIVLLPIIVLGALCAWWLFRHPVANLMTLLAAYVLIISPEPGIQLTEAFYGLYLLAFLGHWYGTRLLAPGVVLVGTFEDRLVVIVLVLGVVGGALLGLAMGAPLNQIRGETMALGTFAMYFPIKEACFRDERTPGLLIGVILWLGVFVAVRNFLHLEEILLAATQAWQIADARFATSETHLVVAALATLLLAVARRSVPKQGFFLILFLVLFGSLILTKSRAYWLAFLIAVVCGVFIMTRSDRRRFLLLSAAGVLGVVTTVLAFFGSAVVLLLDGIVRRFATLESAVSQDISLINRFVETRAVWDQILDNPLLGYGLGYEYGYHSLVYLGLLETSFIHNGYIWLWHKLGLWGLTLFLLFYGRAIWCGLRVYRHAPVQYQTYGLWGAISLLGLAPAFLTSNVFPLSDIMLVHAVVISLLCGLKARYAPSPHRELRSTP